MLNLDLKSRFRNKAFLLAMVSAIVLLIQQLGFKDLIPSNYADIVNSVLSILTMVGIVVDTSTTGLSDKTTIAENVVQATNEAEKVEVESASINTVTENSASSKIVVDNPDNFVAIGNEVNAVSASSPQ